MIRLSLLLSFSRWILHLIRVNVSNNTKPLPFIEEITVTIAGLVFHYDYQDAKRILMKQCRFMPSIVSKQIVDLNVTVFEMMWLKSGHSNFLDLFDPDFAILDKKSQIPVVWFC